MFGKLNLYILYFYHSCTTLVLSSLQSIVVFSYYSTDVGVTVAFYQFPVVQKRLCMEKCINLHLYKIANSNIDQE